MKDLMGKTVLITGGAHGFGKAMAVKFGKRGSRLILVDIDKKLLEETTNELKGMGMEILPLVANLSNREEAEGIIDKALEDWGNIDVLVNNAGVAHVKPLTELSVDEINDTINVNLMAPIWITRRIIPHFRERRSGHIVNIASLAGRVTSPGLSLYAATKSGLIGFTDTIMQELRDAGVKTTIINPSYANTGMFAGTKMPLFFRWVTADEVANAVIRGVEKEKAEIFIPFYFHALAIFRVILFPKVAYFMGRLTKSDKSLENWVGRQPTRASETSE